MQIDSTYFNSPVIGIDPISKGTFKISYAYMLWPIENEFDEVEIPTARGEIVIEGEDNPLYKIAQEEPLRLQGLIGSVKFGIEKRFIKILSISAYFKEDRNIVLSPVTFEILTNLQYIEEIGDYRDINLI